MNMTASEHPSEPNAEHGPQLSVGAVATRVNELLMVRRKFAPQAGKWSVPGGRVRRGETLAGAVVRELREETSLGGVCGAFMGWAEVFSDGQHHVVLDFEVTILDHGEPTAGDDAQEAAWIPVWTVPELPLVDGLADFLADQGIIETLV